jgi:hypothetical protein
MPQAPAPRLSSAEQKLLVDWVNAGMPAREAGATCSSDMQINPQEGANPDAPTPADRDAGLAQPAAQTGGPDDCEAYYELRAHGAVGEEDTTPFMVRGTGENQGNQYHCFYLKPPYDLDDQGLWFAPIIDNKAVLHHWLLYGTDLMLQESGSTSPCSAAEPGAYLLAGWAPGTPETNFPVDVGMQMPSAGMILEVHYFNQTGTAQPDRSGVKFCTAKKNTREHTQAVHFTGGENICVPPDSQWSMNGLCDPSDAAGDIHITNLWPHMHKTGRRMKVTIHRANGTDEVIHDKAFDFNLQLTYPLDLVLKGGDTIETECFFENDTHAAIPFGENTQEEMCYGFISAWPAGALVTDPIIAAIRSFGGVGQLIQPARRCLDPVGILASCNGLADYPIPQ